MVVRSEDLETIWWAKELPVGTAVAQKYFEIPLFQQRTAPICWLICLEIDSPLTYHKIPNFPRTFSFLLILQLRAEIVRYVMCDTPVAQWSQGHQLALAEQAYGLTYHGLHAAYVSLMANQAIFESAKSIDSNKNVHSSIFGRS